MSKPRKFLYSMLLAFLLAKIFNMIFNKTVTVVLPKTEFAQYIIVINSVFMITGIAALGMSNSLMRYLVHYDNRNEKKEAKELIFTTMLYTNAFQTIILALLFIGANLSLTLFQDNNYSYLLILISVLCYFRLVISVLLVISYSRFDSLGYFSLTTLPPFLLICFTLLAFLVGFIGSYSLIYANIIANGLILLLLLVKLIKNGGFGKFSFEKFRDSLKFAGPLVVAGQFESLSQFFLLALLYSIFPEQVAVFAIGSSIANLLQIIRQVIPTTYSPLVIKYYEVGRHSYLNYFVNQTFKIYLIISVPILLGIYALSPFLIEILSTKEYLSGTVVVLFLSATNLLQTGRYMTAIGYLLMTKANQIALVRTAATTIKIIIGLFLIPWMGMAGLAISLFLFDVFLFISEILVSQKLYKIQFQRSLYLKISILTIISFSLAFLLYHVISVPFELSLLLSALFFGIGAILLKIITIKDFYFVQYALFKGKMDYSLIE